MYNVIILAGQNNLQASNVGIPLQGQPHWFDENEHKSTFLPKYKQQLLDIVKSKN
jgi:hypothetical protein